MVVWTFYGVLRLEGRHLFCLCVIDLPLFTENGWNFGGLAWWKGWIRLIILSAFLYGISELRSFRNKRFLGLSLLFTGPIDSQNLAQLILIFGLRQKAIQIIAQCIDIQKLWIGHSSDLRIDRWNIAKVIGFSVFLKLILLRRTEYFLPLSWIVFVNGCAGFGSLAWGGSLHAIFEVIVCLHNLAFTVVAFVGFVVVEVWVRDRHWIGIVSILTNNFLLLLWRDSKSHFLHRSLNCTFFHFSSFITFLSFIPNISINLRFFVLLLSNFANFLSLPHIILLSILSFLDGIDHLWEDVPIRKKWVIHIQKSNYKWYHISLRSLNVFLNSL